MQKILMAWRSFCGDYTFGMAPSLDSSDHQDYYMFSRHSERNLHELHWYSIPGAISKPKTRMGSATSVSRLEILWRSDGRLWSNGLWISNQVEKFMMLYHWFISQQLCMCTAVINIYIYILGPGYYENPRWFLPSENRPGKTFLSSS